ncbi:MAG: methionine adenosyltransferase [Peptococcaceae bacterium]|nr:methionine adenosyltransferase [Peptococcaceae bacterium]MEE0207392.1 methionine adenosyltransferase [Peptococcaceae bacterium]
MKQFFTSESVTEGHPDKIADQISDAILDAILEKDPNARVACETFVTTGMVLIAGEISTKCYVDMPKIARGVIKDIGYHDMNHGFDYKTCAVLTSISEQSADIAMGVDKALEAKMGEMDDSELDAIGAGDQGMMFGYASDETDAYMPLPVYYSHALTRRLAEVRKSGEVPFLLPDGKSQLTVEYVDGKPTRIDAVTISTQHTSDASIDEVREAVMDKVIKAVLPAEMLDENTRYYINPTGRFVIGGPQGDTGLTGRKIIVDTYGGMARHGGGALSGKDGTKVDRSGAYAARYVAKNIVAAGLAKRCEVQLAYTIGVARPMSIFVETFGTGIVDEEKLAQVIGEVFDLRPAAIIRDLDMRKPMYRQCAAYGHFGRTDIDLPWERLDKVDALKQACGVE